MSFLVNQNDPQGDSSSIQPPHGGATDADEREYDRLRGLAKEEAQKRGRCFERSRAAYTSGDRAAAHTLSEKGKSHGAAMDRYNAQARDYIFRANNAHQPADTIDLHGLYVAEAEEFLQKRIGVASGRGDDNLCVIVGKGVHSAGNVAKIRPAVEKILGQRGLHWQYEQGNEGKMVVRLDGGVPEQQSYQQGGRYQKHNQQQQQQQKLQQQQRQQQLLQQQEQQEQQEQLQQQQKLQQQQQLLQQQKLQQLLQQQLQQRKLQQQQQQQQLLQQQQKQQQQQQLLREQKQQKQQQLQQQLQQLQQAHPQQQYPYPQQQYPYPQQQYPQQPQQQYQRPVEEPAECCGCCVIT